MALITTPDKQTGQQHTAAEYNAFKTAINENTIGLTNKASKINGLVPLIELPPVYLTGLTGAGTESDPYVIGGGVISPEMLTAWLKSLPNWAADRFLQGDLTWVDAPTGQQLEKLATPVLTFGIPVSDAVQVNWTYVANGTVYSLQRDSSVSFTSPVNVYSGTANNFLDIGLNPNTVYYYRARATAAGFAGSNYAVGSVKTDVPGNVTPAAPTTGIVDDTNDTFNWTNTPGYGAVSDYQYTFDGGNTYLQLTAKPLIVGDISKPVGQVGVRIKAVEGRNVSATLYNAVAFTRSVPTPAKPTLPVTDDANDTFDWTNTPGYNVVSDYEITVNGGSTWVQATVKPLYVGNVSKGIGQIGVRVRAKTDINNVSLPLYNTVAFTIPIAGTTAITNWSSNGIVADGNNLTVTSDTDAWANAAMKIPASGTGFLMCDLNNATGTGITIGLSANELNFTNPEYRISTGSIGDHKFLGFFTGNWYGSTAVVPSNSTSAKGRIRLDGTEITAEYSVDAGTTWVSIGKKAQPMVDLFVKAYAPTSYAGSVMKNIVQSGFLTA